MYGNKVGMEETQEYNYPTSIVCNSYYTPASAICDLQAPSPRAVGPRARCL